MTTLGTIGGLALVYDRPVERRGPDGSRYWLTFKQGSVVIPDHAPIRRKHDASTALFSPTMSIKERPGGIIFAATLPYTNDGHAIRDGVRNGTHCGVSAGVKVIEEDELEIDGRLLRTVTKAELLEITITDDPSMPGCTCFMLEGDGDAGVKATHTADADLDRHIKAMRDAQWRAVATGRDFQPRRVWW
jgi:phage head maturation protease